MRVVIFGATRATGRRILDRSLAEGVSVTAFVRTPPRLSTAGRPLNMVTGDVTDPVAVGRAVDGQDVVFCALGAATPLRRDPPLVVGVQQIVDAMTSRAVRRLVYLSFLGVHEGRWQLGLLGRVLVAPLLLRNVVADHEAKEEIIKRSYLDWVIVRPPRLTNGPYTGRYRHGTDIRAQRSCRGFHEQTSRSSWFARQLTTPMYDVRLPSCTESIPPLRWTWLSFWAVSTFELRPVTTALAGSSPIS